MFDAVPIETGMVTIDAAAMAKDISTSGHVALYGIHFDTDKADLKPESQTTLQEITTLLARNPSLKLYIVAYRDLGIFYENAVNRILEDCVAACRPRRMTVTGRFASRRSISVIDSSFSWSFLSANRSSVVFAARLTRSCNDGC